MKPRRSATGGERARARPPRRVATASPRRLAVAAGERWERDPAPASARRARLAVGAPVRLLPRRREAAARARRGGAAGLARRRSAPALRARAARLRPRGIGALRRGRGDRPACARRRGARAVGDPRRRPRDGDAGAPRRKARAGWASGAATGVHAKGRQRWRANGFAGHLGWHEALFALEGLDTDTALRVFDHYLDASRIEITLQRVDAAALLWRLRLLGAESAIAGSSCSLRWPLDAAVAAGRSVFNDVHATMALIGAGESDAGAGLGRALHRRGGAARRLEPRRLARARRAADARPARLRRRPPRRRGAAIAPLRERLARIGGSHAQRDVVEQTLLRGRRERRRPRRRPRAARGADARQAGDAAQRVVGARARLSAGPGGARPPASRSIADAGDGLTRKARPASRSRRRAAAPAAPACDRATA